MAWVLTAPSVTMGSRGWMIVDSLLLQMQGGLSIHVLPSIGQITTHVILEQERWFEREWSFIRRWLRPGMRCLDVGANLGVYTLIMAQAVGPSGRVWAVEPASSTASLLRKSLADGQFAQASLIQCALADRCGQGELSLDTSPELNRLHINGGSDRTESVEILTLDELDRCLPLGSVDFLKLDAEGAEPSIIAGGSRFLEHHSPLIMFEWKHGKEIQTDVIGLLAQSGFRLFRLIGPDVALMPVDDLVCLDPSELNLFACREGRAAQLQRSGHLVPVDRSRLVGPVGVAGAPTQQPAGAVADEMEHLVAAWQRAEQDGRASIGLEALASIHGRLSRHGSLDDSLSIGTLSWIARFSRACALNHQAAQALALMIKKLQRPAAKLPVEWVSTAPEVPSAALQGCEWTAMLAHVVDAFERCRGYAGCFVSPTTLPLLEWLQRSLYGNSEMERRRQLMALRAGKLQRFETSRWFNDPVSHLNATVWADPPEALFWH